MRRVLCLTLLLGFLAISIIAGAQTPLAFLPIGPCRIVDTRAGSSQPQGFGGPTPGDNSITTFILPNNPNCNVPNEAFAYALNVTVVPDGNYLGYLSIYADDQASPPATSTLNSYDGRTKANAAIVAAGAKDQGVNVYVQNATDVIIDVTGYFVPSMTNPPAGALHYFSIPQTNVCNIFTTLFQGGAPLPAGTTTTILPQTPGSPQNFCLVPSNAVAYSLNFTAIPVGGQPLNYLQAWPDDQPTLPHTSILNAPTGTTVANAAIVEAGSIDGGINVYNTDATDLTVDINGYFAVGDSCGDKSPQNGSCAMALYVLQPDCRAEDTRAPGSSGPYVGPQGFDIHTGLPASQNENQCTLTSNLPPAFVAPEEAYVLNATVIPDVTPPSQGGLGAMYIWSAGFPLPLPSTLSSLDGYVASNMTIVPSFSGFYQGVVNTNASNPTNLILDMAGFFATDVVTVITPNLPAGTDNVPYVYDGNPGPFQMLAWGGVGSPYTWVINNLPNTLGYTSGGLVGGVPDPGDCPQAPPGTYFPTAQATDAAGNTSVLTTLSISIKPALQHIKITTNTLPPAPVNDPYNQPVVTIGGLVGTYTFALTAGSLPDNFSLNPATGVISSTLGPPIQDNGMQYDFVVTVTDQQCPAGYVGGTYSQALSISVPIIP